MRVSQIREAGDVAGGGEKVRDAESERHESSSGMCVCGGLAEDNARFVLLAVVLAAYMVAGAALFQRLEADVEIRQV